MDSLYINNELINIISLYINNNVKKIFYEWIIIYY